MVLSQDWKKVYVLLLKLLNAIYSALSITKNGIYDCQKSLNALYIVLYQHPKYGIS
jgi:hypothetical protein